VAENVTHLPPAWATAKDKAHPAWQPFLAYLKVDGEQPTPRLWSLWYAAFLRGETVEWEKQFKAAAEGRGAAAKLREGRRLCICAERSSEDWNGNHDVACPYGGDRG
jgi:hypothetical protein